MSVIGGVFPSCVNCCGHPVILHLLFSLQIGLLRYELITHVQCIPSSFSIFVRLIMELLKELGVDPDDVMTTCPSFFALDGECTGLEIVEEGE